MKIHNDPSKVHGSLEKIFSDVDYGKERLAQLQLDQTDIHPVMVRVAEARLFGKGRLVNTTTHQPANPHHSKKDVADAVLIIKRICLEMHKRQPKWLADEKKWFKQFGRNGIKAVLCVAICLIVHLLDKDQNGIPDFIEAMTQHKEQPSTK